MGKGYSMSVLAGWLSPLSAARTSPFTGLLAHELLLLFSEGSMTLELELMTGKRVDVELEFMGERGLSPEEAGFLGVGPGDSALERKVWLVAGGERLIFAHTLIPVECVDPEVKMALDAERAEPIGRVLASKGVLFAKERLEAALVKCDAAAQGLGMGPGEALYARRYILYNRGTDGWVIKAAVTEVFSPELVGNKKAAR